MQAPPQHASPDPEEPTEPAISYSRIIAELLFLIAFPPSSVLASGAVEGKLVAAGAAVLAASAAAWIAAGRFILKPPPFPSLIPNLLLMWGVLCYLSGLVELAMELLRATPS
jgi:hypothetical protein